MLTMFISFLFNYTATAGIFTLSLHDALPISLPFTLSMPLGGSATKQLTYNTLPLAPANYTDRKSTRLNSSHTVISYAVFCVKKKRITDQAPYLCKWLVSVIFYTINKFYSELR